MDKALIFTIGQVIISVGVLAVALYLAVTGQPVPEWLFGLATAVVGFYVGSRETVGKAIK